MLIAAGLMLCAHFSVAVGEEYKDAKKVDLTKPSPEATIVQAVNALKAQDKDAYLALCSTEFKENEKKAAYIRYKGLCRSIAQADFEKEFQYKVAQPDPNKTEYIIKIRIGGINNTGYQGFVFKMGKFGDKFLITGL